MEDSFYRERLEARGLRVLLPEAAGRELVHRVIYEELCLGRILDPSRTAYEEILGQLVAAGAQGVILGCTEISLLVAAENASVPLFDTTLLHAEAAALLAI
jgi:aspartate racemase